MMKNEELSEIRRILCNGAAIASDNIFLDLKFISSSVVKRWMISQDADEVKRHDMITTKRFLYIHLKLY
jgi:hypothetical protein